MVKPMLKKNFIVPAIFMLTLGITYLASAAYYLIKMLGRFSYDSRIAIIIFVSSLVWPILMLVEAWLYWRIRNRNLLRKASWAHCCLIAFGYLSFFIKGWIVEYIDSYKAQIALANFIHTVYQVQITLFWLATIGGHSLFIRVLVKARAQKHVQVITDPANLLDDALS